MYFCDIVEENTSSRCGASPVFTKSWLNIVNSLRGRSGKEFWGTVIKKKVSHFRFSVTPRMGSWNFEKWMLSTPTHHIPSALRIDFYVTGNHTPCFWRNQKQSKLLPWGPVLTSCHPPGVHCQRVPRHCITHTAHFEKTLSLTHSDTLGCWEEGGE